LKKKRVLLICYYFPPQGGAGVGHPLALYKQLPDYGIDCDILTVKPVAYRYHEPELLDGLDTQRIYRAGSHDPQRLMYLLGIRKVKDAAISKARSISDRYFPEPKVGWVRPAARLGRVLANNRNYDCILSTSPPIPSHLVGQIISKEFKLPWIADFRDFWTGYKPEDWFNNERQVKRARALLDDFSGKATAVTVVSPAIAEYLKRGVVIYNSYDENRAQLWNVPTDDQKFTIGVLGTIDEQRPIEPLFKVVADIRRHNPEGYARTRILHVGSMNAPDFESLLDKYQLGGRVELCGVQKRERTIEILSEASMLYLGFSDPYGSWLVTGRLFDMLASGRPILASAPQDGVAGRLIDETGNGYLFDDDRIDRAAEFVLSKIKSCAGREFVCEPNPPYARKYASSKMVEAMAQVIDKHT